MLAAPACDHFIGKKGWGGYTWNTTLFPNVTEFVEYLHDRHVQLAINFHPDNGKQGARALRLPCRGSETLAERVARVGARFTTRAACRDARLRPAFDRYRCLSECI